MSKIWVIAAGDDTRDLVPNMLINGVMMIGPGATGDLKGKDADEVDEMLRRHAPDEADDRTRNLIIRFRDEPKEGNLVVLRLGSVCFAVGAVAGPYRFDKRFSTVFSHFNARNRYQPEQVPWNLCHVHDVEWYVLKDQQAIYLFRQGIYAGGRRFFRMGPGGEESPVAFTRKTLHKYLNDKGYNGTNGSGILKKIGVVCKGVNEFGWPAL